MAWNRLSERIVKMPSSAIRKYFSVPKDVISLGVGEPDFIAPERIRQSAIEALKAGQTHYTSNAGIQPLREAVCKQLEELYQVKYDPEHEIILTVGASEALFIAMAAIVDPGDEIIVVTPCFSAYQNDVKIACGVPIEVACRFEDNFELNPDELEKAVTPKTKGILIGFPNNPTGAVASRETLQKVVNIAEKYNLAIISDEIYGRLIYGVKHVCVPSLEGAFERTILVNGFSKAYAMTGFRIGYIAAPRNILDQIYKLHQYLIMSAPTMAQFAAYTAVTECEGEDAAMCSEYDRRRKMLVKRLNDMGLPTFEPKGAFYAFPKITSTGLSSVNFADKLLAEGKVALIPGSGFGKGGEGFVRVCYAQSYERISEALDRIEKFVKKYQ